MRLAVQRPPKPCQGLLRRLPFAEAKLALGAFEQPLYVVVMRQRDENPYHHSKQKQRQRVRVEEDDGHKRESYRGGDRPQRNKTRNCQHDHKNNDGHQHRLGIQCNTNAQQSGDTFAASKAGEYRKDVSQNRNSSQRNAEMNHRQLAHGFRSKIDREIHRQPPFEDVEEQYGDARFGTQHTDGVGGAGIAAALRAYVDAIKNSAYPYRRRDASDQKGSDEACCNQKIIFHSFNLPG